jgi:glycosyltransferase involved in cell wall biosynthesis
LDEVVAEWERRGLPAVVWEVHGGGGLSRLRALRRLPGVRVRGYYRHGSLPDLLRRRRIDLCLLLPQVPESFSLTLSEVLASGTPLLALSSGALSDRLRCGGGHLLPNGAGAGEVVEAVRRCLAGESPMPPASEHPPSAREGAVAYDALHAALLAEIPMPASPPA